MVVDSQECEAEAGGKQIQGHPWLQEEILSGVVVVVVLVVIIIIIIYKQLIKINILVSSRKTHLRSPLG